MRLLSLIVTFREESAPATAGYALQGCCGLSTLPRPQPSRPASLGRLPAPGCYGHAALEKRAAYPVTIPEGFQIGNCNPLEAHDDTHGRVVDVHAEGEIETPEVSNSARRVAATSEEPPVHHTTDNF